MGNCYKSIKVPSRQSNITKNPKKTQLYAAILFPSNIHQLRNKISSQQLLIIENEAKILFGNEIDFNKFKNIFHNPTKYSYDTIQSLFYLITQGQQTMTLDLLILAVILFKQCSSQQMVRIIHWLYSAKKYQYKNNKSIRIRSQKQRNRRVLNYQEIQLFLKQNQQFIKSQKQYQFMQFMKEYNKKTQLNLAVFEVIFSFYKFEQFKKLLVFTKEMIETNLAQMLQSPILRKNADIVYVVQYQWFLIWKKYMENKYKCTIIIQGQNKKIKQLNLSNLKIPKNISQKEKPTIIRNYTLGGFQNQLKRNLVQFYDYILLPQQIWKRISIIYEGGPAYKRRFPEIYSMEVIQLYVNQQAIFIPQKKSSLYISVNKEEIQSLNSIINKDRQLQKVKEQLICFYKYPGKVEWEQIKDLNQNIQQILTHNRAYICFVKSSLKQLFIKNNNINSLNNIGICIDIPFEEGFKKGYVVSFIDKKNLVQVQFQDNEGNLILKNFLIQDLKKFNNNNNLYKKTNNQFAGLQNLTNSCYINSVIQCLIRTPMFSQYLQRQMIERQQRQDMISDQLYQIFQKSRKSTNLISTSKFKKALDLCFPSFKGFSQQDAQEFLISLLSKLSQQFKQNPQNNVKNNHAIKLQQQQQRINIISKNKQQINIRIKSPSKVSSSIVKNKNPNKLFSGINQIQITCKKCKYNNSKRQEGFFTYSISLPQRKEKQFNFIFIPKFENSKYSNKDWIPIRFGITLNSKILFKDAKLQMGKLIGINQQYLYFIPSSSGQWMRDFSQQDQQQQLITYLNFNMQILCYQITYTATPCIDDFKYKSYNKESMKIEARHRYFPKKDKISQSFSIPLLIQVSEATSWIDIDKQINNICQKFTDKKYLTNKNQAKLKLSVACSHFPINKSRQQIALSQNNQQDLQYNFRAVSNIHTKNNNNKTDKKISLQNKFYQEQKFQKLDSNIEDNKQILLSSKNILKKQQQTPDYDYSGLPYKIRIISKTTQNRCLLCRNKFYIQKQKQNKFTLFQESQCRCSLQKNNITIFKQHQFKQKAQHIIIAIDWQEYLSYKINFTFDKSYYQTKQQTKLRKDNIEHILKENMQNIQTHEIKCERNQCSGTQIMRKQRLVNLPNIFIIHLKRFRFENSCIVKMMNNVEYPINMKIDMEKYELYAVIVHSGTGLSGHYISYVNYNNKWFKCDDQKISEAQGNQYLHCQAYILFYKNLKFQPSLAQVIL